jgi:hypothetical protein
VPPGRPARARWQVVERAIALLERLPDHRDDPLSLRGDRHREEPHRLVPRDERAAYDDAAGARLGERR